jgi:hypothetical protein
MRKAQGEVNTQSKRRQRKGKVTAQLPFESLKTSREPTWQVHVIIFRPRWTVLVTKRTPQKRTNAPARPARLQKTKS